MNATASKFKAQTNPIAKPEPDPEALAAFASGADAHETVAPPVVAKAAPKPVAPTQPKRAAPVPAEPEPQNRNLALRLTQSQMDLINDVYENSTYKSKQKMIEAILFPELERMQAAFSKKARG